MWWPLRRNNGQIEGHVIWLDPFVQSFPNKLFRAEIDRLRRLGASDPLL